MLSARLVQSSEILQLIRRLEKFVPHSLQAFYLATAIHTRRWQGVDFYVDSWPNFSALVSKPSKENEVAPFCRLTTNEHSIFHTDVDKLHSLLFTPGVVDWSRPITWSAVKLKSEVELLEECAERHGGVLDIDAVQELYVIDPGEVAMESHCTVPTEMYCTALTPSDALMVTTDWQVSERPENVEFVEKLISNFPTTSLRRRGGDDVVAYALMYHFGSYGMAFVKPEYRGNQYFTTVTANLIKYAKRKSIMPHPFGFIPKENIAATSQSVQFGGTLVSGADTAWCFYRPQAADTLSSHHHRPQTTSQRHNHPHDEQLLQEIAKR